MWIEREDFQEVPPPKYFRLSPGREVRLRGAYFVTATEVVKDRYGTVIEVLATYDPASKGGNSPDGRKVKSTMHWVSAPHAAEATVALYNRLFLAEAPGEATGEALDDLNPTSREVLTGCRVEAALRDTLPGEVVQFERLGYFAADATRAVQLALHGPRCVVLGVSDHLRILVTLPAPTVRPPSRMANLRFSSMAMGLLRCTVISVLSPGMTISVPAGS